ncbi:hypothetical protein LZ30DRAFT_272995 [Colletotrichum cereale]|nr:hypothetical protein LZ30DRAFT_272995 [Colletotrichum cereale]
MLAYVCRLQFGTLIRLSCSVQAGPEEDGSTASMTGKSSVALYIVWTTPCCAALQVHLHPPRGTPTDWIRGDEGGGTGDMWCRTRAIDELRRNERRYGAFVWKGGAAGPLKEGFSSEKMDKKDAIGKTACRVRSIQTCCTTGPREGVGLKETTLVPVGRHDLHLELSKSRSSSEAGWK